MQKRNKPADRQPAAGRKIPLTVTRILEAPVPSSAAAATRQGKMNYLAPSKKAGTSKPAPKIRQRIERKERAVGQYIGDGEKMIAFIWLDEDTAPKEAAAND